MDIKERMKVLTTVQRYIKKEVIKDKSLKNYLRLNELLDTTYFLAEELPDHEIEYDSLTGDSTREFYQDLAEFLVKEAVYLINKDIREGI